METFTRWANVPTNLKTKTQLKKLKLKPIDLNDYVAMFQSPYGEYQLYDKEKTKEIRGRKKINVEDSEITLDSIAESLYIINKSAKKSRDSKIKNYQRSKHAFVKRSKGREYELYNLKNNVLLNIKKLKWGEIIGYHVQTLGEEKNYLQLIKINDFTFHQIIYEEDISSLKYLGEIGIIPATKLKTTISFLKAIAILEKFITTWNPS